MSAYLLTAVREQPDDDLARLAYADWLEENGEADRAQFVRLQLSLDREPTRSPQAGALAAEAEGLLAEHERRWLGEWAELLVNWTFRRGLLDSVTLEPEVFLTRGGDLFATLPIREVRFVNSGGDTAHGDVAEEIVASPHFARVRAVNASGAWPSAAPAWCRALARAAPGRLEELSLGSAWIPGAIFDDLDALRELCEAEHLRGLKKLDLSAPLAPGTFGDEGVALLVAAPFFHNLEDLSLSGWQISDDGLRALITGRRLPRLQELDLSWCEQLNLAGSRALAATRNLPNLTTLCLGGDIDVSALARSPLLAGLERLDLCTAATRYDRTFGPGDWRELAASPNAANLRRLTLLHSLLDEAGCQALFQTPGPLSLHSLMLMGGSEAMAPILAKSPALGPLTALELVTCEFGPESVRTLLAAPFVANLRQFCVAGNQIQAAGLQAVLRSPLREGRLDDLHLHHCGLPPGALKKLFAWPGLENVTRMELGSNTLDEGAMDALLASPHLGKLTALHLGSGQVSEEGLFALARSRALPRLRELTVGSSAGADAVDALRERFGARLKVDPRG